MYLGNDEILEMYLGEDSISEAYLGDVLVFSSGPFAGLTVIPRSIGFNPESLSGTTKVKSSEPWQITSNPLWITASPTTGDSGETIVTLVSDELSAATSGSVVFESNSYSASLETSFNMIQFVDAVRMSTAPNWSEYNALNTHIPVGDTGATIRVKYWGVGVFSDRIVGTYPLSPDADDYGIDDDQDFRYFPYMADAGVGRLYCYGYDTDGQYYDITFGNLFVYDNIGQTMVANNGPQQGVDTRTSIRIDMSVNWISEVIITANNNVVADFKAAKLGNDYGMYDTVSSTFLTDATLNIVPRTAPTPPTPPTPSGNTRTLEITDIPTPPSPYDFEIPYTKIFVDDHENYAEFGIVYDWNNYQYVISTSITDANSDPVTGFTTAFTNSALTIDGPWGDEVNISYEFNDSDEFGNCLHVGDDSATTTEYFDDGETAVSSITLTFPSLEVDAECQCGKEGGDWDYDNNICLHDAYLVIDVSSIPNDGNVHEYKVVNGDGDVISVFSIDTSDWSYTITDDPDSAGFSIYTDGVVDSDGGDDFSQGWFRWILIGKFYGSYEVLVDNTSILADPLDYDGSPMVEHILYDGSDASVAEYGSFEEWDCMENNCGNWNSQTGECDCV